MRPGKDLRVFFALWPDDGVRQQILNLFANIPVDGTQGQLITPANIHLTLHFIGNISFAESDCLKRQAAKVNSECFQLGIDRHGFFSKPKVFWLGCEQAPQALFDLQTRLGRVLLPCGFVPEERPFNPHVSIARKLAQAPLPIVFAPIQWKLDRFVLVESRSIADGVQYRVIEEYALS